MEHHYYGCIATHYATIDAAHGIHDTLPQHALVVIFDTAAERTVWINEDAANRFALTSKDARRLMTATLSDMDVRDAARFTGGVELPTAAECKTMGALIAAYTAAAAYCFDADADADADAAADADVSGVSEETGDTAAADTVTMVSNTINAAARVASVPVEYSQPPQLSGRTLSYALIIDGYDVPFDLHIGAAAMVRAELIETLECAADDVRDRMDATDVFNGWSASLTDGHEDTDDPAVMAALMAKVTALTIETITADAEFYSSLLRLTAAMKAAA